MIALNQILPQLENKQRILITGNQGTKEIFSLVAHILDTVHKTYDRIQFDDLDLSDAPIVFIEGFDELNPETGTAYFRSFNPHIALFHKILEEHIPTGYVSYEQYIEQFEILADSLPKAGSFIYYNSDNVSMMIGKKEREDVKNIEYAKTAIKTADGFEFSWDSEKIQYQTSNTSFSGIVAAAYHLLARISITDSQFINGLKTYSET